MLRDCLFHYLVNTLFDLRLCPSKSILDLFLSFYKIILTFLALKSGFSGLAKSHNRNVFSWPPMAKTDGLVGFWRILAMFLPPPPDSNSIAFDSFSLVLHTLTVPDSAAVTNALLKISNLLTTEQIV